MTDFYAFYPPPLAAGSGSGTVTQVDTGTGLTGGPITGTGTVSLVVPVVIANGGTNSTTALSNNRVMKSAGGKIVEAAAITAARALISDANGIPTHSVTTSTELGYVSGVTSSIQAQLDAKEPAITPGDISTSTTGVTVGSGTGSTVGPNVTVDVQTASAMGPGLLSASDWSTFDGKQDALTIGNLTAAGTDGIAVTGGTGAVIGSGAVIAQHVADSTHNGYLSSTDWSTFNGKQASGNYITALTGDVTATGPGSAASTVAKIQGTTVSGTTGTGNVVFSTAPTLTLGNATGLPLTTGVTGVLPLANGGTNKNLTASAGAVLYTDTDSVELVTPGGSTTVLHGGAAPSFSQIVNADVSSSAAIAGSKISPTFTSLVTTELGITCINTNTNNNFLMRSSSGTSSSVLTLGKYNCTVGNSRLIECIADTGTTNSTRGYVRVNASATTLEFEASSDRRIKRDVAPLDGLAIIEALNPVSYVRKDTGLPWQGFIAQEVASVLPYTVTKTDDGLGDDLPEGIEPWTMSEQPMLPYAIAAIKELKGMIESLRTEIESLKEKDR